MNFIIIGDKFQKRMKSKGCVGLIKVNNYPIIQHQYKSIKHHFPEAKIIYIYGFENKKFLHFINKNKELYPDLTLIYNELYETNNNAYSLYLASKYLNEATVILFGDNILNKKIFHKFNPSNESQVFINKTQKNKLGCIIYNSKIENISYDLDNYLLDIYYLSTNHALMVKEMLGDESTHNRFIFEIINRLIDTQQSLVPFFTNNTSSTIPYIKIS